MIGTEAVQQEFSVLKNGENGVSNLEKNFFSLVAKRPLILAALLTLIQTLARFLWDLSLQNKNFNHLLWVEGTLALVAFLCIYVVLKWVFASQLQRVELENGRIREENMALNHMNKVTTLGLSRATEVRDVHTSQQIRRIGTMAARIAETLAQEPTLGKYISAQYIEDLRIAAPLYDIGRIGLPDSILEKDVGLTEDEFATMKMHVIIGGDLVAELQKTLGYRTYFSLAKEIVYHHHQRWDGTGYPKVLKNGENVSYFIQDVGGAPLSGEEIPLSARIVALTDVYNALISHRVWRPPFSHDEACSIIEKGKGQQFDPKVVDAFLRCRDDIRAICKS